MKIIIPMAGLGKRMRPHTLSTPKPLIPVAGKPIVHRLAEDIVASFGQTPEEIAFVIGNFGKETEKELLAIAEKMGAAGKIYYQDVPLGTAHAVDCAAHSLSGPVVVAFADTLFRSEFSIDAGSNNVIWVSRVEDPRLFGVVQVDDEMRITGFAEKPAEFVSDLAIIGIYYFNDGGLLRDEIHKLIRGGHMKNGEYQLTDVLENMMHSGKGFTARMVEEWLDCGNKNATLFANRRMLEFTPQDALISPSARITNSVIHPPCFIGESANIENSTLGPHVSVGNRTCVRNSSISNSIILADSEVDDAGIKNSMIGNHVQFRGKHEEVNLGDYTTLI